MFGRVKKHTFRNSSRSSLKPSATEDIQNFLNLSFNTFSFSSAVGSPLSGRNEGISAGGGEGEGDRRGLGGSGTVDPAASFDIEGGIDLSVEVEETDPSESELESDDSSAG